MTAGKETVTMIPRVFTGFSRVFPGFSVFIFDFPGIFQGFFRDFSGISGFPGPMDSLP